LNIFTGDEEKGIEKEKSYQPCILIVDDEKFNCDIISSFLMLLELPNRHKVAQYAYNGE